MVKSDFQNRQSSGSLRYQTLLADYGCNTQRINVRKANETGDVKLLHGKLQDRIDQHLLREFLLRRGRDFASREEHEAFVQAIIDRANGGRSEKHATGPKRPGKANLIR